MANKTKILSDLSKIALDAMSTFQGVKKEIETIVKLKVDNAIHRMNLVKREEFEVLKKIVQKISIDQANNNKSKKKSNKTSKKTINKSIINKKKKAKK